MSTTTQHHRRPPAARLHVRVPADQLEHLRDLSARNDRPLGREVQRAIAAHLERERREQNPTRPAA